MSAGGERTGRRRGPGAGRGPVGSRETGVVESCSPEGRKDVRSRLVRGLGCRTGAGSEVLLQDQH